MIRDWKPNVTVASVIERDGLFLMVEEQTAEGLRLNQPAGHLERGESLLDAAIRETFEETAHTFTAECLVGVYQWTRPQGDLTYVRFTFGGSVGEADMDARLDAGIVRVLWLSPEGLRSCTERHRSPLVMRSVDDWLAGRRCDLGLLGYFD